MAFVEDLFQFLSRTVVPIHNKEPLRNGTAVSQIIKRTDQCKVGMQTAWLS